MSLILCWSAIAGSAALGEAPRKLSNQPSYQALNEILSKDPNNQSALLARGSARAKAMEDAEALADFDKLISLNPNFASAYEHRSECYMHTGKFDLAEKDLRTCIKVCKTSTLPSDSDLEGDAAIRLSTRLIARGKVKDALSIMEDATKKSKRPRDVIQKAQCECLAGLFDRAQADFDYGLKFRPDDIDALMFKADCLSRQQKYEDAVPVYSKAISIIRKTDNNFAQKDHFRLLDGRANAYKHLGKNALADGDLKESKSARNELFDLLPFRDNSVGDKLHAP